MTDRSRRFRSRGGRLALALMTVRLHIDGFRTSPRKYLLGSWWRILGKRLRARSIISPLLGCSGYAYHVWLARHDAKSVPVPGGSAAPLIIIVEATDAKHLLPVTLASLDAPDQAIIVDAGTRIPSRFSSVAAALGAIDCQNTWLLILRSGDIMKNGAQDYYAQAAACTEEKIVYADDDRIDAAGNRSAPHFKPDWNFELFRHHDYLSWSCILKADPTMVEKVAESRDWVTELTGMVAATCRPQHLPTILHHRAERPLPTIPALPDYRIVRSHPRVAIIIPTRNGADLLRACLNGIAQTDYPDLQIIVVDNDSDDPDALALMSALEADGQTVIRYAGAFNYSAINNTAVRSTDAPILCFLNNDIEIIDPQWLYVLVEQALRDDVGAVGPMLLYPDGSVQHAGVVLGVGGGAGHAHRNQRPDEEGYFLRHRLPQFTSAVTGACLVVQKRYFDAVGGFDERNFPVAFNDVDLCLKLTSAGYNTFYEPRTRLIHHESKTRGHDRDKVGSQRLACELQALKDTWGTDTKSDPYHHPLLSPYSEKFVLDL